MTKVLVIEPAGELWGSERALLDLIEAASDLEIAVCCPPNTLLVNELEQKKVLVFPFFISNLHEKSRWQRLLAAAAVLRSCLIFKPCVIHLNQSGVYRVVRAAAAFLRIPIVSHVRIFEDAMYLAKAVRKPCHLAGMIAISDAIKQEIKSFPTLAKIPVHKIYDAYTPVNLSKAGESTGVTRIACVGRVVPIKGQEVLIDALRKLDEHPTRIECLIIGDGNAEYVAQLKQKSEDNDSVKIQWLGFVKDVMPLLATCEIMVCPSSREPLGRVVFESWDAGAIPIVFAGSGGAAEIVADSGGGLIYAQQTPNCLARVLKSALELADGEHARLVKNGRSWMARCCDPEQYGRAISQILMAPTS